jgi:metal-responsive CopG/Arc/MetJ family transcriptional regulator
MPSIKQVRKSVSLPTKLSQEVSRIAKRRRLSDNRVIVELLEQGIEVSQQREQEFFKLATKFRSATDPMEVKKLGNDLGRFVFGE